ncbi:hypothetical protein GF319_06745 [Candidatus Bathyarchaeota archaeon]|nr:hypothetical protein [Candidatus Bathyarchaeota archaeon]
MQLPFFLIYIIVYSCGLALLSGAFSLNHLLDDFPDFTQAGIIATGIVFNYYVSTQLHLSPYTGTVMAFLIGGFQGVIIHALFSVLKMRGRDSVQLTLASLGGMIVLTNLTKIWQWWIREQYALYDFVFTLRSQDFTFQGNPGVLFISLFLFTVSVIFSVIIPRTGYYVVFNALSEDKDLAMIQGVDVTNLQRVYHFFTGGISCLVGALFVIFIQSSPEGAYFSLIAAVTGALFGGVFSPRDSFIGGFFFGVFEVGLIIAGQWLFGPWVGEYRPLVPVLVLSLVLRFKPDGVI